MFKRIAEFFQEVKLELKKVVFPTRKEVIGSTWVVIVSVLIAALFLWAADLVAGNIITRAIVSK
jgi:preprotein translocase subunit SecE